MTLADARIEEELYIKEIQSNDDELVNFLFSLGCYKGEPITIISRKKRNIVLAVKDARYNIDIDLAKAIHV